MKDPPSEKSRMCMVVVVYEDADARQRALSACDCLMQQLWSDVEFEFHWWRTDFLEHTVLAHAAAEQAAVADFLIYCGRTEREVSPAVKAWFESWIAERGGREGALLNLTTRNVTETASTRSAELYLRGVAHRAMLDYFETAPPTVTGTLPSSFEEVERRARQSSSVLDDILNQPPRPPSFGLND